MNLKEYEAEVRDLEVKLDRLRSLYEQYFKGIERIPPSVLKKEVEAKIRNLAKISMKNTAMRFKLHAQIQRFTTFLAYWQRMLREEEEGKRKPPAPAPGPEAQRPEAPAEADAEEFLEPLEEE